MKKFQTALILTLSLFVSFAVSAAERHVHLNEVHLEADSIAMFDSLTGYVIPDGNYWLNDQTGAWGVDGYADVLGYIQNNTTPTEQVAQNSNHVGTEINTSQNGSYVSGRVNGRNCQYVSAGGSTMRVCD